MRCVLQDFEALTPNLLARTIETVEGGGIIILLLKTMTSLKQLYTMTMDVHARYRTESHQDTVARFNERFILSLAGCESCLVVDDELNVLPISSGKNVKKLTEDESRSQESPELQSLKLSLKEINPAGPLIALTKTTDQAKALLTFIDAIQEKTLKTTVSLTASRGRGKSASLGLSIAAAIESGYANIFITSPSPENLKTLFEFLFKGFDALNYVEHLDYDIIQSTNPAFNKCVVRVNIHREKHRQIVQWILPSDSSVLTHAELVVVDEAAAIPLPVVKKLINGNYLVFMASTIHGYEGTGRSLSLKLIKQLREQSVSLSSSESGGVLISRDGSKNTETNPAKQTGRKLREVKLSVPIRYAENDKIEKWLHDLLCLADPPQQSKQSGCPHPSSCELYYVNRDTLFSFHPVSEHFLKTMMGMYVASHYKNSPDDLMLISDAPAHHLFVLLPPSNPSQKTLPEPLVVIQVAMEGKISRTSALESLRSGKSKTGDLIPWVVSQQFQDDGFSGLSGARIVRIATNPNYEGMGYGSRAVDLLERYYKGDIISIDENDVEILKDDVNENSEQVVELNKVNYQFKY